MKLGIILALASFVGLTGCGALVNDEETVIAVEKQGWSNVKLQDSHIFFVSWQGCGRDDAVAYEMTGENVKGQNVDLIVCAGLLKGVTFRTN